MGKLSLGRLRLLVATSVVWGVAILPVSDAFSRQPSPKTRNRETVVAARLTVAISEFQEALLGGDAQKVLGMIAREGLDLGPDPEKVPRDVIERDFRSRGVIYCGLFDGPCLRDNDLRDRARVGAPAPVPPLLSVAEHISGTPLETTIQQPDGKSAIVRFCRVDFTERRILEFTFELQDGKWVITEIPTW